MSNERQVLINLIAGLSLADHMGDAWEDAYEALKQIGVSVPDVEDESELADFLAREHGAQTVWGTSLIDEDDQ